MTTTHQTDSDCTRIDATGTCLDCGVATGDACPLCKGERFHTSACNWLASVDNCSDCQDGECSREKHQPANLPAACSCTPCKESPKHFRGDCCGNVHAACNAHERYLQGWIDDVEFERNADSAASLRYELAAYGRD